MNWWLCFFGLHIRRMLEDDGRGYPRLECIHCGGRWVIYPDAIYRVAREDD